MNSRFAGSTDADAYAVFTIDNRRIGRAGGGDKILLFCLPAECAAGEVLQVVGARSPSEARAVRCMHLAERRVSAAHTVKMNGLWYALTTLQTGRTEDAVCAGQLTLY